MSIIKKPSYESYGSPEKDWFHSPKKDSFISWLKKKLVFFNDFFMESAEDKTDPTDPDIEIFRSQYRR